jgi:PAS domain S-box-containing protein
MEVKEMESRRQAGRAASPPALHALRKRNRVSAGRSIIQHETVRRRKDGTPVRIQLSSCTLRDGSVAGTWTIGREITEDQQVLEALHTAIERYEQLVESVPCGILYIDSNGEPLHANRALAAMLGYRSARDLFQAGLKAQLFPGSKDFAQFIRRQIDEGEGGAEVVWQKSDRTPIRVRLSSKAFRSDRLGAPGYEIFVEDLSATTFLAEQLGRAQAMQAMARLAGTLAHDFDNLLEAITGYAQLLGKNPDQVDAAPLGLARVQQAAEQAALWTSRLQTFASVQAAEGRIVDLRILATEMMGTLLGQVGGKIDLFTHFDPNCGQVRANPAQVEQVLRNLTENAREAMPDGGSLTIEIENIDYAGSYRSLPPGAYVRLTVSDTGCGMQGDTLAHIFEPFFTTKERGKGAGIGLAIVYDIVRQWGGSIWAQSQPEQGATFTIHFPRVDLGTAQEQE